MNNVRAPFDDVALFFGAEQVHWADVINLMLGGLVTTFAIMALLAGLTWTMGRLVRRFAAKPAGTVAK